MPSQSRAGHGIAAAPIALLHLAMVIERASHQTAIDLGGVARWCLAVALLVCLRRARIQFGSMQSPAAALAAVLIFALIHAPLSAPDPALPIAVTGLGLALSMAFLNPDRVRGIAPLRTLGSPQPEPPGIALEIYLERLKDRAPPALA